MSTASGAYEACICVYYDSEDGEPYSACACGHAVEEHDPECQAEAGESRG